MLASPAALRRAGVLGINARNCLYVAEGNPRRLLPRVNDKIATKEIAAAAGVPTPGLIGIVEIQHQAHRIDTLLGGREDFVVKPARGAQGNGILVITERLKRGWRRANRKIISDAALGHHVSNVLSGMYSLNGMPDRALLEERVRFANVFDRIAELGVPDLRILVFRGVPALAMARVPTLESDGKANLHKGGLGVGLDLGTGRTTVGVYHDRMIEEHPETGEPLAGIPVPSWRSMLAMAARCHDAAGLDYLGVDLVVDVDRGPMVLELNARPGLAVQLANRTGLRHRLEAIEAVAGDLADDDARVDFAMDRFGSARLAAVA